MSEATAWHAVAAMEEVAEGEAKQVCVGAEIIAIYNLEGTLFPGFVVDLVSAWTGVENEAFKGFFDSEIDNNLAYVQTSLGGRDSLLASGFCAADINLAWALEFGECRGRLRKFPALTAWVQKMRARPAYMRALERGGPQDLSVFAAGVA